MAEGAKSLLSAYRGNNLREVAGLIRLGVIELSHRTGTAHIGSCLSVADILAAAYWGGLNVAPETAASPDRDRLVFGKGHAAAALLSALAARGFFPLETLDGFNREGGLLQEHPGPDWPAGVETAAGSLGHALSIAVGLALAASIQGRGYRVCAVIGDGECNEGSVWEAAMFAGGQGLARLCAVVDLNGWQGIGRSGEITALEPLADKWRAFGWHAIEVDGHDPDKLRDLLAAYGDGGKPTAIIARTVKGKGVSFMEDDNHWHYRTLKPSERLAAVAEIAAIPTPRQ
ncbi:MAG: transketolase [Planctomycetota bacterium]|jgi:transketolase|nr:transketolase [Planctomycetota bacterium]